MSGSEGPPEFKRALVDVIVHVGSSTKFLVEIKSSSQLSVAWYHDDEPVANTDRLILLQDNGIFCVQIREVTPQDQGTWTCRAENANGGMSCFSVLKIQIPQTYRAPEFVKNIGGCLWDNGTLSLDCEVVGVPTPMLRWYKDGKQLLPGSALKIKANSKESKSFLGLFACEAENCMGSKAAFSKVYARHFGNFLKQFGNLNTDSSNKPKTKAIKSDTDSGIGDASNNSSM